MLSIVKFIECAVALKAEAIITGDKRLKAHIWDVA